MSFDFTPFLRDDLPPAAKPWGGFAEFNFVGGHVNAASVPGPSLVEALAKVMQRDGDRLGYYGLGHGSQGYLPLREYIAQMLAERTGMPTDPGEILITTGSLQGMDLVNDALLQPGDTVILEAVNYGGQLSRLRKLGVNYVGIEVDEDGMKMDALEDVLAAQKAAGAMAKYIYTIPTVQNPSATVMSLPRRQKMLDLAREYGIPIFEDDCYAELLWEGERPQTIRSLDDQGQVIYCGTFSKTIAPSLRTGYLVADWSVLSRLMPLKTDGGCGALEQMALAEYCPDNYANLVAGIRQILKGKWEAMAEALGEQFGAAAEFRMPKGGLYIWVTLPAEVDTDRLTKIAGEQGVAINPGSEWAADADYGRRRLRVCFGHPSKQEIRDGIARLAEICHAEFGVPLRGANVER
ncbi:MAG: PLP-dependent aminotransferase family protein [Rhodospirillaceae bacterium]|nr:PLP-dependent aminotransferase family protein [Rhodospirillaceae bacterium]